MNVIPIVPQAAVTPDEEARIRRAFDPDRTGAGCVEAPAPAKPIDCEGVEDMSKTIGGTDEDFSLEGTGISHIPGVGRPTFEGLLVGADGSAVARIRDGALVIEIGDLDLALAWRAAWQNAVAHLVIHRQKSEAGS